MIFQDASELPMNAMDAIAAAPKPVIQQPETFRVVLLSGHYFASRRKAGFHFLAEACARRGWNVTFMTVGLSRISKLRGDPRFAYPIEQEANRPVPISPNVTSFVWYTPWHPFHLRSPLLDRISTPLARAYSNLSLNGAETFLRQADMILVESTVGLLLVDRIRQVNPLAKLVYRVSDDPKNLGLHAAVIAEEERVAPLFDLISAPSRYTAERLSNLGHAIFHPQGLSTELFNQPWPNPFPNSNRPQAISVGSSFFDTNFVETAAAELPEWDFHIIGKTPALAPHPNLILHGEMPFRDTLPFFQHADVGLAPYVYRKGAETLADSSLKLMQYTYCRLPTVAPEFATRPDRPHILPYRHNDPASIRAALLQALDYDRTRIKTSDVRSWDELVEEIARQAGLQVLNETKAPALP